jgi:mono/diheme cytochrome c family protein
MFHTRTLMSPGTIGAVLRTGLAIMLIVGGATVAAQADNERGALLYETHCIACHTTEAHWRDKKQATNWNGLVDQVRIWQANANLNWGESDIESVSVYLNRRYYRFEPPAGY